MGCGCNKKAPAAKLSWVVDLAGTDKVFPDGSTKKTFVAAGEAAVAIARLGLTGKVRPRPASGG